MVQGKGMLDAFERVGWGGILIGGDGCVIGLNGEARRHVGLELAVTQGHITASHRPSNAELQRLIYQEKTARRETPYCCSAQTHVR